jgi:hypothetical protein
MARDRRGVDERPLPAHPYRDTVVVYGIMAIVLIVVASLTGGSLLRAVGAGVVFFVLATAWSWWKFRTRIRERDAQRALEEVGTGRTDRPDDGPGSDPRQAAANGAANGNGNGREGAGR